MTSVYASIGNTAVFSETLRYASAAKDQSAVRFDGNISEITAIHGGVSEDTYVYGYDGLKRLTGADRYIGSSSSSSLTRTERNMVYDRNGNITALKRYGDTGLENDLTFTHTGNRMTGLSDAGTPGGSFSYSYDAMGNQTSDGRKGLQISYNILNLPCGVTSATSGSLTYTYLSDGTKVSAIRSDGSGKRYVGSMVYSVPASGSGSETIESAAWDEGRVFFNVEEEVDSTGAGWVVVDSIPGLGCYRDCWYVTDHLGNVRTVVDVSPGLSSPQVVERNDYLPFGTRMGAGQATLAANRYRLGGKEEQVFGGLDLGKVDFGARQYDPFTARWTTQDPMAFVSPEASPYSYCLGDPIGCYDPFGLTNYSVNGEMRTIDDGYDDTIEVSQKQFSKVNRIWNRGLGERYDAARASLMDSNGYIDGSGNPVLAASSVSAQYYNSPFLAATAAVIAADLSAPEQTDLCPAKWAAYAGVYAVASISELIAKRDREIEGIKRRSDGPGGIVYSLRTTQDGLYLDVRKGLVFMREGEIWKYGETTQQPPEARYGGKNNLNKLGFQMIYETKPMSQKQIKIKEKYLLYDYYMQNGHLPPGNAIFR